MKSDDWKLHYTFWGLAFTLAATFGLIFIKIAEIDTTTLMTFATLVVTAVVSFWTGSEVATRQARATERATAQGAAAAVSPPPPADPENITVEKK